MSGKRSRRSREAVVLETTYSTDGKRRSGRVHASRKMAADIDPVLSQEITKVAAQESKKHDGSSLVTYNDETSQKLRVMQPAQLLTYVTDQEKTFLELSNKEMDEMQRGMDLGLVPTDEVCQ